MKCLVCISQVPDTTTKIVFDTSGKELNKNGVTFIINPYDEYGISRSLEFKEKTGQGSTTILCVGKADVDPTIRKALAVGADDSVRIDADSTDAHFVAHQIAEYAKGKGYDLIFFGKESIDGNGSQVAGMVAEKLGIPFVSLCKKLEVEGGKATVQREIEGGTEVLESSLPLVLSVQKGISEWRIPNVRGIMAARTKPLQVIPPIPVPNYTQTLHYELPPAKSACQYVPADNVSQLVTLLSQKGAI